MAKQNISQDLRQIQRLNLKQIMLGKLVEMSTLEFEEEVVRMLEENPALTVVDTGTEPDDYGDPEARDPEDDPADAPAVQLAVGKSRDFRQVPSDSTGADTIEQQLAEMHLSELDREIARYVIGNLDSWGYLKRSAPAIADDMTIAEGIDVSASDVQQVINIIKTLEPAGLGAADTRECLLIQLERTEPSPAATTAETIVADHFDDLLNNRKNRIREAMGISAEAFDAAFRLIKSLNPKPGLGLFESTADDRTNHIIPDYVIEEDEEGRLIVSLTGNIPELGIDESFRIDDNQRLNSESYEFVKEHHEAAQTFIEAIRRRTSTLLKIMKAIVALQPDYFRTFSMSDLKPMVIRDIEQRTGIDKSMISRTTSTKYMMTPQGSLVLLKDLFNERASTSSDAGRHMVEDILKKIIDEEDKSKPLSDDKLCARLKDEGISVARRTVTKYRERLGFPEARLRRT